MIELIAAEARHRQVPKSMPNTRHLNNAPITEAVIDFRVKPRPDLRPDQFEALKPRLMDRFPKVELRRAGRVTFELLPGGAQPPRVDDLGMQGVNFRSADDKLIAQFRGDGFTLNRLEPYTSWDELFPVACDLWQAYVSVAMPELVTRIAVRYINHITLPDGLIDLDKYLRAAPQIPKELPQGLAEFMTRMTMPEPDLQCAAHVTQVFPALGPTSKFGVVLDIDAFSDVTLEPASPVITEILGRLRLYKNRIFFGLLTEETLGRLE